MLISYFEWHSDNEAMMSLLKFDDTTFFFFCLPPIVFASGFNMKRGNFFANLNSIALFGVIGTFVAFGSFSLMTILAMRSFNMTQYKYDNKTGDLTTEPL